MVENPQTLIEKIAQKHAQGLASGKKIKAGSYIALRPQHIMSHDNTWPIAKKWLDLQASKIHDNRQLGALLCPIDWGCYLGLTMGLEGR